MKHSTHFAVLGALCVALPCLAQDSPPPTADATVTLEGGVLAAGVGYKWGHGTLTYHGRLFKFCARGVAVGDVGAASVKARGVVYHLESLDDFSGRYFALSEGVAVARGEAAAILKNDKGVEMELEMVETGVRVNMAVTELKLALLGEPGCKPRR